MRRALVLAALLTLAACKLDSFLFNKRALDAYQLSNAIIPDSLRQEVVWDVDADKVVGVFARQPGPPSPARLTVLFCHGNKHDLTEYWDRVEALWQAGVDVLIFDYRGYGRSTGNSSETTMRHDSEAALAWLHGARGVKDSTLVVHGLSLGGVCAIHLAGRVVTPRVLISEAAFADGSALVHSGTVLDVPSQWLLNDPFDNLAPMSRVTAPVLVMHGTADVFIDPANARRLSAAATSAARVSLIWVAGAGHGEAPTRLGMAAYGALIHDFAQARGVGYAPESTRP
jgi:alpha-beta hydrolase superfamily lysophospholipase